MKVRAHTEEAARDIAQLLDLDRSGCLTRWRAVFKLPAPKHLSVGFMRQALAHRAQVEAFGGLTAQTRRALVAAAKGEAVGADGRLTTGTRVVREWNGRTHEVEVLVDGFLWRGRRFRSLSAIAREITGARWSGPRFFGTAG